MNEKLTREQREHAFVEWMRKYGDAFTEQAKHIFFEGFKSALTTNTEPELDNFINGYAEDYQQLDKDLSTPEDELHCAEHLHIGLTCDCEVCTKLYTQIALRKIEESMQALGYDNPAEMPVREAIDWLQQEDKNE